MWYVHDQEQFVLIGASYFCRFRTQFCDRGIHCNQPFCFFAHTVEQLRMPSANEYSEGTTSPVSSNNNSCGVHCFEKSASFGPSTRSMSFDRSNIGAYERSTSFDSVSPPMARLSDIQSSLFPRNHGSQMHARRYSDFHAYDGIMSKTNLNMPEPPVHIPRHLGNGQGQKEPRSLHQSQTFQVWKINELRILIGDVCVKIHKIVLHNFCILISQNHICMWSKL